MSTILRAVVQQGRIELLEPVKIPEGTQLLVTVITDEADEEEERAFWMRLSEKSFAAIWDNPEDDIYGDLLQE